MKKKLNHITYKVKQNLANQKEPFLFNAKASLRHLNLHILLRERISNIKRKNSKYYRNYSRSS